MATTTTPKSKESISSTVSDPRRPSTTLSIAERFMSSDYNYNDDGFQHTLPTVGGGNSLPPPPLRPPPPPRPPLKKLNTGKKVNHNLGCSKAHSGRPTINEHKRHKHLRHARNVVNVDSAPEKIKIQNDESTVGGGCCFIQCGENNNLHRQPCCCYWGRRAWVMTTFLMVIMMAVMVFFFWPQIPLMRIEGAINTTPTKVTQAQQEGGRTSNVAFESTWLLNITMDNRRNLFTTRFNRIQIIAKDAMTGLLVGKGAEAATVIDLPGKEISTIQLPIFINYQARDSTDPTFSNLIRACHSNNSTTESSPHHSLPIHFWFTLYIFGLDWLGYKPTLIATPATGGFFCPSSSLIR